MFDLDLVYTVATESGLPTDRPTENRVSVVLGDRCTIHFENRPEDQDTLIGFDGVDPGWHSHGDLWASTLGETSVGPVAAKIIELLIEGTLLVEEIHESTGRRSAALVSRDAASAKYIRPGETVSYFRVAAGSTRS